MQESRVEPQEKGKLQMTVKYRQDPPVLSAVCLFSSYSFSGTIEPYVYYYLQQLQKAGFAIAFISTSPLKASCIEQLSSLAFLIIEKENRCPDFGSWKAALSLLNWGANLNEVLLVNDSVFGPFYDIGEIIFSMRDKYDVWGMTENHEIAHHLQSYFLHFNKKAVNSAVFSNFWKEVNPAATKEEVIQLYEIGLSQLFSKQLFSLGAYAGTNLLNGQQLFDSKNSNPTLLFWKSLITNHRFPFLKRELLIRPDIAVTYWTTNFYINTSGWRKTIEQCSRYPVQLIEHFLSTYAAWLNTDDATYTLKPRKMVFLMHSMADTEGQRLLVGFLQWLKAETTIEAEIIICNNGNNDTANELAGLGIVTHLYELSETGKQHLKHRLAEETALLFSFSMANLPAQQFLSILNVPQFIYVHESASVLQEALSPGRLKWLLQNITEFVAGTTAIGNMLLAAGVPAQQVTVIHKYINEINDLSAAETVTEPSIPAIPAGSFVVGMSGNIAGKASADLLPVIAAQLCRKDNLIHIIWMATGGLPDAVKADLDRAGITGRVHPVSHSTGLNSSLHLVDVFVMISPDEVFPLINLECGHLGIPVISFDGTPGAAEYASFGTGHTVPYLNLEKLAETVFAYYNDRTGLEREKQSVAAAMRAHFTTAIQAPKIAALINQYYDGEEYMISEEPTLVFFTHIYYENSWFEIRNKLKNFDNGRHHYLFSISSACLAKEAIIADIKKSFKQSYFLITSNIGKDIGGKMALIDLYLLLNIRCNYLVFLHDKQSPHAIIGESWKNGLFKIIDYNNRKTILQHFRDPAAGIVGSKDHIVNEYDPGTGRFVNNSQLSKKLLEQFDMHIDNYDFLGGTIYWMRPCIIERFFKKNNPILTRENLEAGNVMDLHGERLAHTWERLFSWMATNEGFTIKGL